MSLFLLSVVPRPRPEAELDALCRQLWAALHFEPAAVRTVRMAEGRVALFHFATGMGLIPAAEQLHVREAEGEPVQAVLAVGAPVGEVDGSLAPLGAATAAALVEREGLPEAARKLHEHYAILSVDSAGEGWVLADPLAIEPVYWKADGESLLVANRLGFIEAADPAGARVLEPMLWLPTVGFRLGRELPWTGARALGPGEMLRLEGGRAEARSAMRLLPEPDEPRGWHAIEDAAHAMDEIARRMVVRLQVLARHFGRLRLILSGGGDSRIVLGLCKAAGLADRIDAVTSGSPDHPDVIAAAMAAARVGVAHRVDDDPRARLDDWTTERVLAKLAMHSAQNEGLLSPWDLRLREGVDADLILDGHLGGVLKGSPAVLPPPERRPTLRELYPFDLARLLRPERRAGLMAAADGLVAEALGGLPNSDAGDAFYLQHRVPNWIGTLRRNAAAQQSPPMPLYDPGLLRLTLRLTPQERRLRVVYVQLLQRLAPELLEVPLAEDAWSPGLVAYGLPESALQPPVRGAARGELRNRWELVFNTQPRLRDRLLDLVEDHGSSPLWDHVDRAAVKALLERPRIERRELFHLLGVLGPLFRWHRIEIPRRMLAPGRKALPLVLLEQNADRAFLYDQRRKSRLANPDPSLPSSVTHPLALDLIPGDERLRRTRFEGGVTIGELGRLEGWVSAPDRPGMELRIELREGSRTIRVLPTLPGSDPSGRPVRTFTADLEEPGREIEVWVVDGGHCLGAVHMPMLFGGEPEKR